jgi:uroporphyrinogen-III decarboxylase
MTAEETYAAREKRIKDAIALRQPDRVPVAGLFGFFPARYAGITCKEAMYDHDKAMKAWVDTIVDFGPDLDDNPFPKRCVGNIYELLGMKQMVWPGHGLERDGAYQFVEKEYMKPDEYAHFISDCTDFIVRRHWPRIFGELKAFAQMPPLHNINAYGGVPRFAAFAAPEMKKTLQTLMLIGDEAQKLLKSAAEFSQKMKELGFPPQFGGGARAPFDVISDYFRGTVPTMLDMHRNPDELLQAIEQQTSFEIKSGLAAKGKASGIVFMPIHKCLDTFMSPKQFETFFWPSLRKVIMALINEGLNPAVFWEGDCTSRLETIADIPAGKAIYWFEKTDIFKAKEVLGDIVCIRGNVPLSLLSTGNPREVKDYCKLLIDKVGKNGGFILDGSTQFDDAKPENLKAMFEFTKEYGKY